MSTPARLFDDRRPAPPRAPRRRLCAITDQGHAGFKIPEGTVWVRVSCPTHGETWCAVARADANRWRAPCPRCEAHEPADPPPSTEQPWEETLAAYPDLVVAWGSPSFSILRRHLAREAEILRLLWAHLGMRLYALSLNEEGLPHHPVRLPNACTFRPVEWMSTGKFRWSDR